MIVLKLQGGLGNQLFQLLAYQRLLELHDNIFIDVSEYNFPFNNGYRRFDLDSFTIPKLNYISFSNSIKKMIFYKIFYRKVKLFSNSFKKKLLLIDSQKSSLLSDDLHEVPDNSYIEGYFGQIRFLSNWFEKFFTFKSKIVNNKSINKAYNTIMNSNSVSVHVRRSDYLLESERYGGICTVDYYKKAMLFFQKKIENPIFYFFSDDIEWCKETFVADKIIFVDKTFVDYNNSTVEDLFLMSCCRHNIIANSTYSWWGAMLNRNFDKIIIRPPKWASDNDGEEIFPKNWITI